MVYSWKYYTCTFIRMSMKTCMKIFIMNKNILCFHIRLCMWLFLKKYLYIQMFLNVFLCIQMFLNAFTYTNIYDIYFSICVKNYMTQ